MKMTTIRVRRSLIGAVLASLAALSCSDQAAMNPFGDINPPTVTLAPATSPSDTMLSFNATVQDNLGIKRVTVSVSGGVAAAFDTTFTSAVTNTTLNYRVSVPRSVPPGTAVVVTAVASDGAGNQSEPAQLVLGVGNVAPSVAVITSPPSGTAAVLGKSLIVSISAKAAVGVRSVGFRTSGVFTHADSTVFGSPLRDSVAILDTLTIPDNSPVGQLTVTPFVIDSLGQRTLGPSISISVQSVASSTQVPTVTFGLSRRVEVTDTIHVSASDPVGITTLGYEVRTAAGGPIAARDSIMSSGNFTTLTHTFTMQLPFTEFPQTIYVQAFATNSSGARAYSRIGGADRVDTVVVVAGSTKTLPQGGIVADALYHPGKDRIYMTNIERNRLEVFSLADTSFKPAIATGSRPWGLAPWPIDHNGTMGDTLLVANSGGTSIGYISLNASNALSPSGREVFTYALPNLIAYTVTTVQSTTAPGLFIQERTRYDFSDRPQYIAATCRGDVGSCGDVVVVYSTTPTGGQSMPFAKAGTLRWENLTQRKSHLFFEQAMGHSQGRRDTLMVERFAAAGFGEDEVLVDHLNPLEGGGFASIEVDLPRLAFRDTTFVRSSADFRRAIIGEGGPILGSRAMMYDARVGPTQTHRINGVTTTFAQPIIDGGVSRATDVSDFIANTFARVRGVAINFDGELAAIRGDSTYLLDRTLRLQGLLQTSGGNAGFDFHPLNRGNGTDVSRNSCFSFAASSEPVIEVYENRHYSRVATIPVRDPIIGPIKAASRAGTGAIVLVGATERGVVVVTLADTYANMCP
jgi:hypothetical protein